MGKRLSEPTVAGLVEAGGCLGGAIAPLSSRQLPTTSSSLANPFKASQLGAMANSIVPKIYVKSGCPWCDEALAFMDRHKLPYKRIVVSGNQAAFKEMTDLSGQSKAPTMDWNGEILADFGAAELEVFLKNHKVI